MLLYIGPGGALTLLGSFLGLLSSVVFAVIGMVWYPITRVLQRFRRKDRLPDAVAGEPPAS